MTVSSTTNKSGPYNGNGVTTNFAVNFKYTAKADVDVIVASSAGVETTQTLDTHYTLTDPSATGTVTFLVAPASGETVTIVRTMDMTQTTDYTAGGGLSSETVEATDDRQLMQIQQIAEQVSRAPLLRQTSSSGPVSLPEPEEGSQLGWDAFGDLMNVGATVPSLNVSAFIATLVDDADAAEARATLGLVIGSDVQAFDADLAAIAALATTAYGRSLLTLANAAALAGEVSPFIQTNAFNFQNYR